MTRFPFALQKRGVLVRGGVAVLFILGVAEALSALSLLLLNISGVAMPWTFHTLIADGETKTVILAAGLLTVVGALLYGWWAKRFWRLLSYGGALGVLIFLVLIEVALIGFAAWEGIQQTLFPWQLWALFLQLPTGSEALTHLYQCLALTFGVATLIAVILFVDKFNAEKRIHGKAHFQNLFEIQRSGLFQSQGLVLGDYYGELLRQNSFENMLVAAPTGSGKSSVIAIPNLIEWEGSAVVNDLKGELREATQRYRETRRGNQCFCFSPASPLEHAHGYNPFFYVRDDPRFKMRDLELIIDIAIPHETADGGFWSDSSRNLFLMLSLYLLETEEAVTLGDIYDLATKKNFIDWLENEVEAETIHEELFYKAAATFLEADAERTRLNVLSAFRTRMRLYGDPLVRAATSRNDFDLRKLRQEKMTIYLHIPEADTERLSPVLTLFWSSLINAMAEAQPDIKKEPYPVLANLDEFGNLSEIKKLRAGLSFLRSYRVCAIVFVQYLGQIERVYGREGAKGFLNTKTKVCFALSDYHDAEYFSKLLGSRAVKVRTRSSSQGHHQSTTKNVSYQTKLLKSPDELMTLNRKKMIVTIEGRPPLLLKKRHWSKFKDYRISITQ